MPPQLAILLTFVFCVFALRRYGRSPAANAPLWLPVIWAFFIASRFPAQWLALFGLGNFLGSSYEEGSPLDAAFFLILIVVGIRVLMSRGLRLSALARDNVWLFVFFGYCLLAILWSDFPFVAFKRWIKTLGHPVMALVILTDARPQEAFCLVFKRVGVLVLTLAVLFIKYLPQYGRGYDPWSGLPEFHGINATKNELGYCCLVFGLFFLWNLVIARNIVDSKKKREERLMSVTFILMAVWLLRMAHSTTSLVTLVIGSAVIIGLGFSFVSKRNFGTLVFIIVAIAATAELTVGVYRPLLEFLGKDATLTDRTEVWADATGMVDSRLFGTGFESFWLGPRLDALWAKWWWRPNQAHNGYIETYLNLGLIGVALLFGLLISTFRKITASFSYDWDFARLKMAFLFVIILYNFAEASFKALHLLWTVFYIIALSSPSRLWTAKASEENLLSDGEKDPTEEAVHT